MDLGAAKADARVQALAKRAGCDPALGAAMATIILRYCQPPATAIIGGFLPLPGEISTVFLLEHLHGLGHAIGLPVTPKRGEALTFRRWQPGDALLTGRFGTQHTDGEILHPDFFLMPLLAFDRQGNRLGYGGGYYDRTLAQQTDAFRLGCAFAAQEMAEVPAGANDLRLQAIATETEFLRF